MKTLTQYLIAVILILSSIVSNAQSNKIEKDYLTKLAESFTNPELVHRADNLFLSKCLGEEVKLTNDQLSTRIQNLLTDKDSKNAFYKRLNFYMSSSLTLYRQLLEVTKTKTITPDIQKNIDEFKGDYAWISRTEVGVSLFTKAELIEYFKYIQEIGEDKSLGKRCSAIKEGEVFTFVESAPEFPGGDTALMKALSSIIIYPKLEMDNDIQGKVIVRFIVCEDGTVSDANVVKSVSPGLDKEAIRAVRLLPKFAPGKQKGTPVKVYYTLPIVFKMR